MKSENNYTLACLLLVSISACSTAPKYILDDPTVPFEGPFEPVTVKPFTCPAGTERQSSTSLISESDEGPDQIQAFITRYKCVPTNPEDNHPDGVSIP